MAIRAPDGANKRNEIFEYPIKNMIKNIWSTQSLAKGILVFHISQMIRHTKPTNLYFVEFWFWLNGVALMLLVSIEGKSMREVWKGPGRYFLWHKISNNMEAKMMFLVFHYRIQVSSLVCLASITVIAVEWESRPPIPPFYFEAHSYIIKLLVHYPIINITIH